MKCLILQFKKYQRRCRVIENLKASSFHLKARSDHPIPPMFEEKKKKGPEREKRKTQSEGTSRQRGAPFPSLGWKPAAFQEECTTQG